MKFNLFTSALIVTTLLSPLAMADKHNKAGKGKAETYKIDTAASSVKWKASKVTGDSHDGNISVKEGTVEVEKGMIKSGNIVVDMNSMTNADLAKSPDYQKKLMDHLKSDDFFGVAKKGNETSTFNITSVEKKSATEILVKGTLTMIGQTQPVEFPATVKMEKGQMIGTANVKLDRTQWGLKYGSGKFFKNLGDKMINDEFELTLNLVAKK
jgi:polyisoprenoid-binding protein YceI